MGFSLMMPCILMALAWIGVALAIVGSACFARAAGKGARGWMVAGGLSAGCGSVVILYLLLWVLGSLRTHISPDPQVSPPEFYHAFHFSATGAEVMELRSWRSRYPEPQEQKLRFRAGPEIIAKVLHGRTRRASVEECVRLAAPTKRDAPKWWTPVATPRSECYVGNPFNGNAETIAWLLYDPPTRQAYFYYLDLTYGPPGAVKR